MSSRPLPCARAGRCVSSCTRTSCCSLTDRPHYPNGGIEVMPVIGIFTAAKDGYAGTIRTLSLNSKVEILANDRSEGDGAPEFRILAGPTEIGAVWRKTKRGSDE